MARGTWVEIIKDFQVSSQIFSDHLPLEVTVILSTTSNAITAPLGLLPSLIWQNQESKNYRTKLDRNLATNCVADLITPDEIEGFLTEFITKAINNRGRREPRDFKQEWYTEPCEAARRLYLNLLRQAKPTNAASAVVMFHEANATYKLTCQNARTQFYINLAGSLDSITDSRAYWSTIRKLNGNSFVKSMEVNANDLGNHFRDFLLTPDWTLSLDFARPWVKNQSLDGCVTGQEGENVLPMLQERKAAGHDRIPSEFIK